MWKTYRYMLMGVTVGILVRYKFAAEVQLCHVFAS
jgi:hypothetical protein